MSTDIGANPFCQSGIFAGKIVHLGISGSVACYKACDLARDLLKSGMAVSATVSSGAAKFISPLLIRALGAAPVYGEMFAEIPGGGVFGHLEPGEKADCLAVVPASANMLAKMAQGLASDMLSAQCIAFNGPTLIAPAMNPAMWAHAATRANVKILTERGVTLVVPATGVAACGDVGEGRLASLTEIYLAILKALSPRDLIGQKVLVTLGPTREPWDGARLWTNPSTGRMGAALATAAWLRGAEVTAICGPDARIFLPASIKRINVDTAAHMAEEAKKVWPQMNMGLFCAAVADFAPKRPEGMGDVKLHKDKLQDTFSIEFHRNPDILATLAAARTDGQKVLGFAAEITPDMPALLPLAKAKLVNKKADIIAANRVNHGVGAFGADVAQMAVADRNGKEEIWSPLPKADIAWELISWLLRI